MIEQIRRLLGSFQNPDTSRSRPLEPRVAAAALLVHVAEADGTFTESECRRLTSALEREFGVSAREARQLVEEGRRADADAIDLYGFTSVLMHRMDAEERRAFVDLLWSVIYADGSIHELEDNLAWRICELLGISTEERVAARREAARRAGAFGSVD